MHEKVAEWIDRLRNGERIVPSELDADQWKRNGEYISAHRIEEAADLLQSLHKSCAKGTACFSWQRNWRPFFRG
jgi:hypothetical protein